MTEEEARPENTQLRASQPDEKLKSQKSLTDKINSLFTGSLSFKQTKEQKTMTNNEETRQESTQSQAQLISPIIPLPPQQQAVGEFEQITKALAGWVPEWCLPRLDFKAKVSEPKIASELFTCPPITCPPTDGTDQTPT